MTVPGGRNIFFSAPIGAAAKRVDRPDLYGLSTGGALTPEPRKAGFKMQFILVRSRSFDFRVDLLPRFSPLKNTRFYLTIILYESINRHRFKRF